MKLTVRITMGALILAASAWSAPLSAQRGDVERRPFEDRAAGYRVKPPKDWVVVPVAPDDRENGLAFQSQPEERKGPDEARYRVVVVDDEADFAAWMLRVVLETMNEPFDPKDVAPTLDEKVEIAKSPARHRRWEHGGLFVDTWLLEHPPRKVGVIATVSAEDRYAKSWLSAFQRSAESFEGFEPTAAPAGAGTTYEEKLAAARADAERTPGWRVVPTPTKKFILTTSSDNQKFVDEVIERLERSREVFEQDYPPPDDFTHVSIVRVCGTEEEFHRYGGTGGGVAGWFNPRSTELVLYDAQAVDRNMSYAVMTHEAFHQYCHFLFGRSEAHRWFDEGHGDYYGGIKFDGGGKPRITARMPGGLERYGVIREMVQMGTAKPLQEHLNYDHAQWQNQGPSNVSCYAQSWSIVYMLRQGMLGKVNSKVWRKEYASVLPNYIATLRKGFEVAYAEERAKRTKRKGSGPAQEERSSADVIELDSSDLGHEVVERIWKEAMDASWGQIDLAQFEEDWQTYVRKYLED